MLAVLITLTPGRRNEFIDSQKAKVRIAVLPIMDAKSRWNLRLQLLEGGYRLREFNHEWLINPKYSNFRPLFTTQDQWTIVKYAMEVLRPVWNWTLWMSKWHTVTLHHIITLSNEMFNQMDGVMRGLAKKKIQWRENLYFAVKVARQNPPKYSLKITPTTGLVLILGQLLDSLPKL
jgi:hypothetical protein